MMMIDVGMYKEFEAGQLSKPKSDWRLGTGRKITHKWSFKRSE